LPGRSIVHNTRIAYNEKQKYYRDHFMTMSEGPEQPKEKDKRRKEKVTIELDMEHINYARVKKVGESTTDIRFREPETTAKRLGFKPEDDYVALPSTDRSKIVLVRVDTVVTRDTIEKNLRSFLSPDAIEIVRSTIEWGRTDFMGQETRGKKLKRMHPKRRPRRDSHPT
jgi:hypothetical protein